MISSLWKALKNFFPDDVRSQARYFLARHGLRKLPPHDGAADLREVMALLPPNPVVLEAGAHNGADTFRFAVIFPTGTIHAFEPVPELYAKLQTQFNRIANVKCYQYALSDHTGTAELIVSSGVNDASSSLLQPWEIQLGHPEIRFEDRVSVPTMTLDEWASRHAVPKIDFMWLDMQGAELSVLRNSPNILRTLTAIHTEVFLKELYAGAPLYDEVRAWLAEQGFVVHRENLAWGDSGNVLFVRAKDEKLMRLPTP